MWAGGEDDEECIIFESVNAIIFFIVSGIAEDQISPAREMVNHHLPMKVQSPDSEFRTFWTSVYVCMCWYIYTMDYMNGIINISGLRGWLLKQKVGPENGLSTVRIAYVVGSVRRRGFPSVCYVLLFGSSLLYRTYFYWLGSAWRNIPQWTNNRHFCTAIWNFVLGHHHFHIIFETQRLKNLESFKPGIL